MGMETGRIGTVTMRMLCYGYGEDTMGTGAGGRGAEVDRRAGGTCGGDPIRFGKDIL
jgi:hypothetical protein